MRALRRIVVGAIAAALVAVLLALILLNIALNTGWLTAAINKRQNDIELEVDRAWSLWPGRVSARGLRILGHDSHVEWLLAVEEASASIELLPLLRRELRLHDGDARDVGFRARRTRPIAALCKPESAHLPPLPRMTNPIEAPRCLDQQDSASPKGGPSDPSRLWQVDLQDIDARDVREVWIEQQRFSGDARLAGGLYFYPTQRLEVRPTEVSVRTGSVAFGGAPMLRELVLEGRGSVEEVGLERGGDAILERLSLSVTATSAVSSVRFASWYLSKSSWVRFDGGGGRMTADVEVEKGKFARGTAVRVQSKDLRASVIDHHAFGSGVVAWKVRDARGHALGALDIALDRWELRKKGGRTARIRGEDLAMQFTTRDLALASPFGDFDATFRVRRATVPDFSIYNDYLPASAGLKILGGTATISGALTARKDHVDAGEVELYGADIGAQYRAVKMTGDITVHTQITGADLEKGTFDIPGSSIHIRDVAVDEDGSRDVERWWTEIDLDKARIRLGDKPFIDAQVHTRMRDLRPVLAVFAAQASLPKWTRGLLSADGAAGTFKLLIQDDGVRIDDLVISGDGLKAQARANLTNQEKRGALLLTKSGFSIGFDLTNDDVDVNIFNPTSKFYEGAAKQRAAEQSRDITH
jgi:hypothetical protein